MKSLKQIQKDESGQIREVQLTGTIAITLVIVLLVYFSVRNSINQNSFTAAQNTTMTNVDSNVNSGLELFGLVVLVSAAALILALIAGI